MKDNNRFCEECKQGAILKNGKCIRCKESYCLSCPYDENVCTLCDYNSKLFNGRCTSSSYCESDNLYCKYCLNMSKCQECYNNFELSNSGECSKDNKPIKVFYIAFSLVLSFFITLTLIVYIGNKTCGKSSDDENHDRNIVVNNDRNSDRNSEKNNNTNNNINLYSRNLNTQKSSPNINIAYEKKISDEFFRLRNIFKKKELCNVCGKNSGKYLCDCGCIVCEKHSNIKTVIIKKEKYKICFNCGTMIKNLSLISNKCNICLQEVEEICNFKCGCAFKVCEDCYIKSKKSLKNCPGCRKNI